MTKSLSINNINHLILYAPVTLLLFIIVHNTVSFSYGADDPTSLFFGRQVKISSNNGTSELPQIATQGSNVYVVWQDNTGGNYDVYFSRSLDNGENFGSVRNLSNNNGTSELPQIETQGSNVYVVWQDNTGGNYDVYFKKSPNNGTAFKGKKVNLSNSNGTSELPQIATQGSNVYVVWQDNTGGNYDVYFKSAYDNGRKFVKNPNNVSRNEGESTYPDVAAINKDIFVIWKDSQKENGTDGIFFKKGHDYGKDGHKKKFGPTYKTGHSDIESGPKIIAGSQFFYALWVSVQDKNNNIGTLQFYPIKLLEGFSPNPIALTDISSNENVSDASIAINNNDAYIVWRDSEVGNGDIFLKRLRTGFFEK